MQESLDLLKEMESLGLGTKATRAQILQTLYDRGYIKDKSIHVTDLGEAVVNSLENYCADIISPELTKKLDDDLESVELGKISREEIVSRTQEYLTKILQKFKENQKDIGKVILNGLKKWLIWYQRMYCRLCTCRSYTWT